LPEAFCKGLLFYKKLQAIIHEEVSYIHLNAPKERIAISSRFQPVETSALRPGYFEETFKLNSVD
jgi:hypothetical protein